MPILDVEIVTRPDERLADNFAKEIADRAGKIFDSSPGRTWAKIRAIPSSDYAENDSDRNVYPVFVSVLKARLPERDVMEVEVRQLTEAIAEVCNRPPSNVHVLYLPQGAGRVAFGGSLLSE